MCGRWNLGAQRLEEYCYLHSTSCTIFCHNLTPHLVVSKPSSQTNLISTSGLSGSRTLTRRDVNGSVVTRVFVCYREEVSLLERNKYKFSPLALPEELPALFHGETLPFSCSATLIFVRLHIPQESNSSK